MESLIYDPGMASPVELRVATDVDLPQLSAVFRRASLSNDGDRAALMAHPDALRFTGEGIAAGRTWVAVTDAGEIAGFATWLPVDSELAELEDLFVEPAWMRRGVATQLVEKLRALLGRSDFTRLEVTANPHADAFYRSVGFAPVGIIDTEFGAGTRMGLPLC